MSQLRVDDWRLIAPLTEQVEHSRPELGCLLGCQSNRPDRSRRAIRPYFVLTLVEATTGIEPVYAVLQTAPWTTRARRHTSFGWLPREDSNLGSRIQSPLSYH